MNGWEPSRKQRREAQEAHRRAETVRMVREVIKSPWTALTTFMLLMALLMWVAVVFGP